MDPNTDKDQPTPSDLQASRWLLEQLPELTAKGVISPADAENLRTRYATQAAKSAHPSLVAFVCSLLGGLLVGCGIILIIAHNWNELGHPVRVALSFLPLIVGIGLSGYALRSSSKAWQEGAATFQVLAVGASISLVSQTYHIAGSTASFLLTWFFLALPVVYLLDSVGAAILCLNIAGMYASFAPKETLLNWTLFLAAAAQLYPLWKQGRSTSFRWLFWFSLYGLLFLLFAEATQAGHRIGYLAVGGFLGSCYLLSRHPFFGQPPFGSKRLERLSTSTIEACALLGTFQTTWEFHWANGNTSSVPSLLICLAFPALFLALAAFLLRSGHRFKILFAVFPVCVGLAWLIAEGDFPAISMLFMNIYTVALSISIMIGGFRENSLRTVNEGMGLLGFLAVLRFADSSLDFVIRGGAYILLGMGFLSVNIFFSRIQRKKAS
ncbi:MAG: DUF2157 domain-containing protein [Verrucomicrobium sp.]|nr:DUF2157 domain-containing protein [Verrucomicrobium sp.]